MKRIKIKILNIKRAQKSLRKTLEIDILIAITFYK